MKKNFFKLSTEQLKEIAHALQHKVEVGLSEEHSEVQCIPTFVYPGKEPVSGSAVVLDLGGTNYRVATVDVDKNKAMIHLENGWKKDLSVMKTPGFTQDALYKELADPICETKRDKEMPVGYCFSYPAESTPDGDAVLLRWTKGVDIPEMVGKPVGKTLLDYLNQVTIPRFSSIKVINDTVASLFAGLTEPDYDAYIGLIVGTGTNMATFIDTSNIPKLAGKQVPAGMIPVNLESGNFIPSHLTSIDDTVDACSGTAGMQRFEKAVSGMYLGEILQAVFPSGEFEDAFDARKLTTIISYPDIHKKKYVRVARWIYRRSAKLVAATLAGLILVILSHNPDVKRIRLIAEGSLFWSEDRKGKNYKDLVIEQLYQLLAELGHPGIAVHIHKMDNANLIGTAIAALS
ncbi:MAG: hexokinase [Tannerellaceae bacterium]|nr:hexokinase [Tannerellaceae bacterium]MCD8265051.1 hexokinase [Tannerellaceae bacterium]